MTNYHSMAHTAASIHHTTLSCTPTMKRTLLLYRIFHHKWREMWTVFSNKRRENTVVRERNWIWMFPLVLSVLRALATAWERDLLLSVDSSLPSSHLWKVHKIHSTIELFWLCHWYLLYSPSFLFHIDISKWKSLLPQTYSLFSTEWTVYCWFYTLMYIH